jgi:hypothetical protein
VLQPIPPKRPRSNEPKPLVVYPSAADNSIGPKTR